VAGPQVARQPDNPVQMFALNALLNRVGMLFEKPPSFSMSSRDSMPYGVKFHGELSRSQVHACVTCNMRRAACRGDKVAVINLDKMVEVGRAVRIFTYPTNNKLGECATSRDGQLFAGRALDV
jgi:ABC-type phosphate transport system ATPase subunit